MTKVFWQCRYSKDTLTLVLSAAAGRQRCFRWLWAPSLTHTHQQQGLCALCSTAVNTSYQQPHTRETQHRASNHVATAQLSCLTAVWVLGSSAVTLKSLILNLSDWVCGFFLVWIIFSLQGCNCLQNIHCGTMEATRRLGNVTSCSHGVWMNLMHLSLVSLPSSRSQTSQGVQPKRFKTLPELVSLYLQPSQGLVTTLLYPVEREETAVSDDRDYSGNFRANANTHAQMGCPRHRMLTVTFCVLLTGRWRGWEAAPPPSLFLHLHSPWTRHTHRQVQSPQRETSDCVLFITVGSLITNYLQPPIASLGSHGSHTGEVCRFIVNYVTDVLKIT